MARRKTKPVATIESDRGRIYVVGDRFDAEFRYPYWLVKMNQNLLLPGFRRDHEKVVYINGKRFGVAYYHEGCIPLNRYRLRERTFLARVYNRLRETTGLFCPKSYRGYYNVKLRTGSYFAVVHTTYDGHFRGVVYDKLNEECIGEFILDENIEHVYPRIVVDKLERTFCVVVGYVMDCMVYSTVASKLNRKFEINYNQ